MSGFQAELENKIRKVFSISAQTRVEVIVSPCPDDENIRWIDAHFGGQDKQFVAVKVSDGGSANSLQEDVHSSVRSHIFFVQDDETYLVFDRVPKSYSRAAKNDRENLEIILQHLAEYQAQRLHRNETATRVNNMRDLFEAVIRQGYFKNVNVTDARIEITRFAQELDDIDGNLLVKSVASTENNIYVDSNKHCIILDVVNKKFVPPAYDALLFIFTLTDEHFRQRHFVALIAKYFDTLQKSLSKLNQQLSDKITQGFKDSTVRFMLATIKLELVLSFKAGEELKLNTLRFLKYPLVNQEDIYEIVYNKLKSTEYALKDYEMKYMDEQNGHLGQYFHLDVYFNNGEDVKLELFVKCVLPQNEFLKRFVQGGPAVREDFFYNQLIPLYKKNNLHKLLDFAPECYLSRHNWILVLNDLSKAGFTISQMNLTLDYERLEAVVSSIAKFTAATLITEEMESKKMKKEVRLCDMFPGKFAELVLVYEEGQPFYESSKSGLDGLHYFLELCPELTSVGLSHAELIKRTDEMYMSIFNKISKSDTFRNAVTHGDIHIGNVLFNQSSTTTKSVLIDFQTMRYIPPALELLFFIHLNSSREMRLKYSDKLVDKYYKDVTKYLQEFGFEPDAVFPKGSFNESLEDVQPAVLSLAFMYAHIMRVDSKLREELFKDKFELYMIQKKRELIDLVWTDDYYRQAMQDYIRDVMDLITKR